MTAKIIPIVSLDEFSELVERNPDMLAEHPFIVQGFVTQWPAWSSWRDLESLSKLFGHLPVTAGAPQFITNKRARMCQVRTDFATYLSYVENPSRVEELFEGQWVKGNAKLLDDLGLPLYCGNLQLVRHAKEAVLSDITPLVPGTLSNVNDDIPYYYQSGNHVWLYVSLGGALTPLHQDNNAVIAYLAQLKGEKEAILYSPDDKPHYFNSAVGYLDPLHPDDGDFPTWREAQPWKGRLMPGDLLIWGPNWAHHVVTISDSITVSFDIVNALNLADYAVASDWRVELGHFARKHADLVRSRIPDVRLHRLLDQGALEDIGHALMVNVLRASLIGNLSPHSRSTKETLLAALLDSGPAMV